MDEGASTMLEEFFLTRLHELGQPRSKGSFRKQRIIEGESIMRALADSILAALALGASEPEATRLVLELDYGVTTDEESREWLRRASEETNERLAGLSNIQPPWRRLRSVRATKEGREAVLEWNAEENHPLGSEGLTRVLTYAMTLPPAVLAWSLDSPVRARDAFVSPGERIEDSALWYMFSTLAKELATRWIAERHAS